MNYLLSEMQSKDIISISNGLNYGHIVDVEVDNNGKIIHFIAENKKIFKKPFKNDSLSFSFEDIEKIGKDVILVRV